MATQNTINQLESILKYMEEAQGGIDPEARQSLSRLHQAFSDLEQRQSVESNAAQLANSNQLDTAIGDLGNRLDDLEQRVSELDPTALEIVESAAGEWLGSVMGAPQPEHGRGRCEAAEDKLSLENVGGEDLGANGTPIPHSHDSSDGADIDNASRPPS